MTFIFILFILWINSTILIGGVNYELVSIIRKSKLTTKVAK